MKYLILTTINDAENGSFAKLREILSDWEIVVVGDQKTPEGWAFPGITYLSVKEQVKMFPGFANQIPMNSYARKNIGYAYAIKNGAKIIAETDDDNYPYGNFLVDIAEEKDGALVSTDMTWVNVYRLFCKEEIWPRGFSLSHISESRQKMNSAILKQTTSRAPVQQYLADGDSDVDAIYRLTNNRQVEFSSGITVFLENGQICPFNSQNTIWFERAFPLLYLPSFVSFRMTDIWRSFVAQICLYKSGERISFSSPTMYQDRNPHNYLSDFSQELPGYLNNEKIIELLWRLELPKGTDNLVNALACCYEALYTELKIIRAEELDLLSSWIKVIADG